MFQFTLILLQHKWIEPSLTFNIFVPNAPFLYLLKTSENLTAFLCFQGVEKGCIGNEWVNNSSIFYHRPKYD